MIALALGLALANQEILPKQWPYDDQGVPSGVGLYGFEDGMVQLWKGLRPSQRAHLDRGGTISCRLLSPKQLSALKRMAFPMGPQQSHTKHRSWWHRAAGDTRSGPDELDYHWARFDPKRAFVRVGFARHFMVTIFGPGDTVDLHSLESLGRGLARRESFQADGVPEIRAWLPTEELRRRIYLDFGSGWYVYTDILELARVGPKVDSFEKLPHRIRRELARIRSGYLWNYLGYTPTVP